jgi:hypothetical protein
LNTLARRPADEPMACGPPTALAACRQDVDSAFEWTGAPTPACCPIADNHALPGDLAVGLAQVDGRGGPLVRCFGRGDAGEAGGDDSEKVNANPFAPVWPERESRGRGVVKKSSPISISRVSRLTRGRAGGRILTPPKRVAPSRPAPAGAACVMAF